MINLNEIRSAYISDGANYLDASSRTAQDVLLALIAKSSLLDIGVHKNLDVKQSDYCFDFSKLNDSVTLFINTKEQIFTEKLKSLLRLGAISSRYKDVFDMHYLSMQIQSDRDSLIDTIKMLIFDDKSMRENDFNDIYARLNQVFHDPRFRMPIEASQRQNWLDAELGTVLQGLLEYMGSF